MFIKGVLIVHKDDCCFSLWIIWWIGLLYFVAFYPLFYSLHSSLLKVLLVIGSNCFDCSFNGYLYNWTNGYIPQMTGRRSGKNWHRNDEEKALVLTGKTISAFVNLHLCKLELGQMVLTKRFSPFEKSNITFWRVGYYLMK